jgi:hypothetical protein
MCLLLSFDTLSIQQQVQEHLLICRLMLLLLYLQCFTKPGFGRVSTRGNDGKVTVEGKECEQGTYNVGGNTAGCQKCGAGLNTAGTGSTSASACRE